MNTLVYRYFTVDSMTSRCNSKVSKIITSPSLCLIVGMSCLCWYGEQKKWWTFLGLFQNFLWTFTNYVALFITHSHEIMISRLQATSWKLIRANTLETKLFPSITKYSLYQVGQGSNSLWISGSYTWMSIKCSIRWMKLVSSSVCLCSTLERVLNIQREL